MNEHVDHLYLDRIDLRALVELLREIPDLVEDLTITSTNQARTGAGGNVRAHRRPTAQPLPYDPRALRVADSLHAVLVSWVRLVCEQRGLEYRDSPTTTGLARWLDRNIIAFAMTEGVQGAPAEIRAATQAAWRVICPPDAAIVLDDSTVAQALTCRLNAAGIAALAEELGGEYRGLTVRRVQTLRDAGLITPLPGPWAPGWPEQYLVGDVLEGHLAHPRRTRRTKVDR
ncbi:hypothetical protein [Nocardia bovistercoris]|uniref:Uncharacterized protein n=1 Tax=Nocardia bovistercoris TaxID=2785916 RepID=A0A931I954_9NOCA|nr:hypothetical protein [Nocardia bovistercoris]MBH0776994.1 hypothetical protein [Nocardia bovistercoris]